MEERGLPAREGLGRRAVERLRANYDVYEDDGALWFDRLAFGDEHKDRVITPIQRLSHVLAADIGDVTEKFSRGFDDLIYTWGADHHGCGRAAECCDRDGLRR